MTQSIPPAPEPLPTAAFQARIQAARHLLDAHDRDALLVGAGDSLRYFTAIPWPATERLVALLIRRDGPAIVVCPRFELGSLRAVLQSEADILAWDEHEDPIPRLLACLAPGAALAMDPGLPCSVLWSVQAARPDLRTMGGSAMIEGLRARKSPAEIALIGHAMQITLQVHRQIHASLQPGLKASTIASMIDEMHRDLGAPDGASFCAVQFGTATAYPHGIPGDQTLREHDLVLIDTGCRIQGYHADITRTYAFGRPDPEHARIWQIEKNAQAAAFAAALPGAPCHAPDDAARAVLEHHGLGPDYVLPGLPHRTGHGLGLSIHEAPWLVRGNTHVLEPGHCASIEPMIVLPDQFGIRLEDHIYLTETGPVWFTQPAIDFEHPFG